MKLQQKQDFVTAVESKMIYSHNDVMKRMVDFLDRSDNTTGSISVSVALSLLRFQHDKDLAGIKSEAIRRSL